MMKQFRLLLLLGLIFLLTACDVVFVSPDGNFQLFNPSAFTDRREVVADSGSSDPQYVICDNKDTKLTYEFSYNGTLRNWSSYLRGTQSGETWGQATFSESQIPTPGEVRVEYTIPPVTVPLLVEPQAIVPGLAPIGYAELVIQVDDYNFTRTLSSEPIPVVTGCP
jgi:hypothetical protein